MNWTTINIDRELINQGSLQLHLKEMNSSANVIIREKESERKFSSVVNNLQTLAHRSTINFEKSPTLQRYNDPKFI